MFISKEIGRAEHEYRDIHPPPPSQLTLYSFALGGIVDGYLHTQPRSQGISLGLGGGGNISRSLHTCKNTIFLGGTKLCITMMFLK